MLAPILILALSLAADTGAVTPEHPAVSRSAKRPPIWRPARNQVTLQSVCDPDDDQRSNNDRLSSELNWNISKLETYEDLCLFLNKEQNSVESMLLSQTPSGEDLTSTALNDLIAAAFAYMIVVRASPELRASAAWTASNIEGWFNVVGHPALSCIVFCCQKNLVMFQIGCGNPARSCSRQSAALRDGVVLRLPNGWFNPALPSYDGSRFDFPVRLLMRPYKTEVVIETLKTLEVAIKGLAPVFALSPALLVDYRERMAPILRCLRDDFDDDLQRFVAAVGPVLDYEQFQKPSPSEKHRRS